MKKLINIIIFTIISTILCSCGLIPKKRKITKIDKNQVSWQKAIDKQKKIANKALDNIMLNANQTNSRYIDIMELKDQYTKIIKYIELENLNNCLKNINYYDTLSECLQKDNPKIMHEFKEKTKDFIKNKRMKKLFMPLNLQ